MALFASPQQPCQQRYKPEPHCAGTALVRYLSTQINICVLHSATAGLGLLPPPAAAAAAAAAALRAGDATLLAAVRTTVNTVAEPRVGPQGG